MQFSDLFDEVPIVAAVKSENELSASLMCDSNVVFLLFGDICNIPQLVKEIKDSGKLAIVHIDLIEGLAAREVGVDFIKEHTEADGIISTRTQLIRAAHDSGLLAVQRFFILDSKGMHSISETIENTRPDLIEIMPGVIPKALKAVAAHKIPVIAGGLIETKQEVTAALSADAIAVSTGKKELWNEI